MKYVELRAERDAGMRSDGVSVATALQRSPAAIAIMCFTFLSVWFVGGLSVRLVTPIRASQAAALPPCDTRPDAGLRLPPFQNRQGFHAYLVSTNQTTYENFRYSYGKGENPFDRGCLANWLEVWCSPRLPRKVHFRVRHRALIGATMHAS